MHVEKALRAGALVQVIDILGDQQQLSGPFRVEASKRLVGGIGLDGAEPGAPRIVESVNQRRIAGEGLRRRHILDPMPFPQAVGTAEGRKSALRGHSRTRQDDDVPNVGAHWGGLAASVSKVNDPAFRSLIKQHKLKEEFQMDDRNEMIDEDRTEGSMKQAGGKMKEGAGKLFGDEKMKRDGQADQAEGKLQNAWGGMKDEAREMMDDDDRD